MKTKYLILIFVMYSYLLPNLFSENIYYDSENEENNIFNNSNIPKKPSVFDYITDDNKLIYIIEKIDRYLENDGDINITNENGNTLLMEAVSIGYYDLADYLIEKKADISITNAKGENALILSANYPYILNLLINNNGDVNSSDNSGKTALHYACSAGDLYSVRLLIKSGADIHKRDILGKTILMYAVENENMELIKYLVENVKVDINEKDDWGQNAIFFATKIEIARYLIYNNINYTETNSIGLKAYEVMKYNGYINVSTYLKKLEKR
ncbi:ankyrin repeat domain-containing protein [uncultured Brachyspira sp.]|uniref:ankyrin repeat domain-containing protein n=1 Tax=uncultured Brachyspira sp. TaxID=221953 RepID=UPI00260EB990|nr:ankyrin repeat domain-containing protein [uncultured Brachyspira sp.]